MGIWIRYMDVAFTPGINKSYLDSVCIVNLNMQIISVVFAELY